METIYSSIRPIPRYVDHLWYPILIKSGGGHIIREMQGKQVNAWNDMVANKCPRCGKVHTCDPVDPEKIVQDHAKSLADEIDRQVMIKVGLKAGADIHAGDGGYGIGTREAYEEFVRKRNERNSST